MTETFFPAALLEEWFLSQKRDLPWRENTHPYAVWVSEVMLQQTQVSTVLPYFKRWMKSFPKIDDLASAPLDLVIKHWEGLGYYSRARNLHQGAKEILERFNGVFPHEEKDLLSIKGIGPYTMGAIRSFAFKERSILIDGNVKRVLSRFYNLSMDFSVPKNHKALEHLAKRILPKTRPWNFNEGMMELGALICTPKKPACALCPIREDCLAFQKNNAEEFPVKVKRAKTVYLYKMALSIFYQDQILVGKKDSGVMQDLHEFPTLEMSPTKELPLKELESVIDVRYELSPLKLVKHTYTHHHVTLHPYRVDVEEKITWPGYNWVKQTDVLDLAFSSGHKRVLNQLELSSLAPRA